jgi:Flp pilus assembly protein TadD
VCFSPEGERLAALVGDDVLCLWDARPALDPEAEADRTFLWHIGLALQQGGSGRAFHLGTLLEREPPGIGLRRALARACADLGDWDGADAHLAAVLDREPDEAGHWLDRGEVAARRGRWEQAAACYGRALALEPARLVAWRLGACTLLLAGDTESYRRLVAQMRERFEESAEPEIAVLRTRVEDLAPGGRLPPPALLGQTPRLFLDAYGLDKITLGRALYRAGQAGPACRMLERAVKEDPTSKADVLCPPLLALCHERLGQAAEARRWLQKVGAAPICPPGVPLETWLECLVLLREARSSLGGSPDGSR